MTLAQLLAGPPSLLAWRRICAALDDDVGRVGEVEAACAGWPDELRRAPGRWLRDLLDGRAQPRLRVVRTVDLTLGADVAGDRRAWIDAPELAQATVVRVHDEGFGDAGVQRWARSAGRLKISELALATGVSSRGARVLAADRRIAGLRSLALFRNEIGPEGVAALIDGPRSGLRRLLLGRNRLGLAGARALAGSTEVRGLELLDLDCDQLCGAAVEALVTAPLLAGVRILNLSNNPIGAAGCAALAGGPLAGLEVLYLHGCGLDDEAVAGLLRAPWLAGLKNLALSDNALSMATIDGLAGAAALRLGELDICHNPGIREAEAEPVLRAAPQLAGLRRLCL